MCGRYDKATPSATVYYQRMLPGSQLEIFEDASHSHHLEKEDEFLAIVCDFFGTSTSQKTDLRVVECWDGPFPV
jgi:proline iminopeptidase